mmetsp:Transcript_14669/g.50980  ORF Transcript_14669/g.50980 Transcript_14669/m.50980 type:complete len:222 (+) Transcript_14669:309-974(+)
MRRRATFRAGRRLRSTARRGRSAARRATPSSPGPLRSTPTTSSTPSRQTRSLGTRGPSRASPANEAWTCGPGRTRRCSAWRRPTRRCSRARPNAARRPWLAHRSAPASRAGSLPSRRRLASAPSPRLPPGPRTSTSSSGPTTRGSRGSVSRSSSSARRRTTGPGICRRECFCSTSAHCPNCSRGRRRRRAGPARAGARRATAGDSKGSFLRWPAYFGMKGP